MAEPTQAPAPVEQDRHSEKSIMSRLSAVVDENPADPEPSDLKPAEPAAKEVAQQTEPAEPAPKEVKQGDPAEPTAEDLPEDAAAALPEGDIVLEIVHDGKPIKLNREELTMYARQGFDYTQKTQAVAERAKILDAGLQRVAEIEQVMPILARQQAAFVAAEAKVKEWDSVDWVRLARDVSAQDFNAYRAEFDKAKADYDKAGAQFNQAAQFVVSKKEEVQQSNLRQQFQKLVTDYVPEWKDPAKYDTESKELAQYLIREGADPQQVAQLSDALSVKIARKAWKYDQLVASKASKSKLLQQAPPVTRPGAQSTPQSANQDKEQQLARKFKKSGSLEDAAALYALRLK